MTLAKSGADEREIHSRRDSRKEKIDRAEFAVLALAAPLLLGGAVTMARCSVNGCSGNGRSGTGRSGGWHEHPHRPTAVASSASNCNRPSSP